MSKLGIALCKIQKGTTVATTSLAVAISEVADINKCLLIVNGRSGYASGTFTSKISITVTSSVSGIIDWQVIEFGGAV